MINEMFQHEPLCLLGVVTIVGFYIGLGARKIRLPSLIGFMLLGIVLGPSGFHWFGHESLGQLSFITEIALGFVAFAIGTELSLSSLKSLGKGIIFIILFESFAAFFVVMFSVYAVTGSWPAAILFGALAPASAPAGTVAVIQEYRAKGKLTKALYAVVGFDDGLAIIIFGFAAVLARILLLGELNVSEGSGGFLSQMGQPLLEIVGSIVAGCVLGFLFCFCIRKMDKRRDLMIMVSGFVMVASGLSEYFHLSLILTNMVIGFVLVNTRVKATVHRVTDVLHDIMPLLFILFFSLAGAHLEILKLPGLGVLGIVYIVARSCGLIGGSRLGGMLGRVDKNIKRYIGLGILSQAGVAIGLGLIVHHEYTQLMGNSEIAEAVKNFAAANPSVSAIVFHPSEIASSLVMTITATCIIFEIIGPLLTKVALTKAGEIPSQQSK